MRTTTWTATSLSALMLGAGPAAAFQPDEVYWAPGACDSPPCHLQEVDAGFGTASPLAEVDAAPGQIAWSADQGFAYLTQFTPDSILRISPAGVVTTWATNIDGPTGLLLTDDGTFLASSYYDGVVYDVTGGGDLSAAPAFAVGFQTPRNLLQLSTGEILVADQTRRAVYDISVGGGADFSAAPAFAHGFTIGVYDLVEDGSGRIFVSTRTGVFEITGGGDFTGASPHASGRRFIGLAVDGAGRLLASEFETGNVFDITSGGDYTAASAALTVGGGLGDSALDTVPDGSSVEPPPAVPALGAVAYGVLASLVAVSGRRARRR